MNNRKIFSGISLSLVLLLASCDNLLDVNTDPNNPAESTPQLTLPVAEVSIAATMETDFNILGSMLAQYWTTGPTAPQYSNIDRYEITTNNYSNAWTFTYSSTLSDLEFVKTAALEEEKPNYAAVAQLLQMYVYQILVDLYDEIPFSEALQGKQGNVTPKYDKGDVVYDQLIEKIDEAIGWIDLSSGVVPGTDDLIYGGDMELWLKFANTLKLKIYIRQAMARPAIAQAGVEALYAEGAEFLAPGEEAMISFSTATHNENTLWQELNQTSFENLVASKTSTDDLIAANDSRINGLYDVAPNNSQFAGLTQGIGTLDGGEYDDYARPDRTTIINPTSPSYFITGYESLFLQAEAAARGWSGEDDEELYNEAVLASFDFWGEDGAPFIAPGGDYEYDGELNTIYYQKWLAFNGKQGLEGWIEWRRTGVPDLPVSAQGRPLPNTFPLRLIWPIAERSSNPNVPGEKSVDTPVWWDTTF